MLSSWDEREIHRKVATFPFLIFPRKIYLHRFLFAASAVIPNAAICRAGFSKLVGFFDYLVRLALFCLFRMRNESSATPRPLPRPPHSQFLGRILLESVVSSVRVHYKVSSY